MRRGQRQHPLVLGLVGAHQGAEREAVGLWIEREGQKRVPVAVLDLKSTERLTVVISRHPQRIPLFQKEVEGVPPAGDNPDVLMHPDALEHGLLCQLDAGGRGFDPDPA